MGVNDTYIIDRSTGLVAVTMRKMAIFLLLADWPWPEWPPNPKVPQQKSLRFDVLQSSKGRRKSVEITDRPTDQIISKIVSVEAPHKTFKTL